MRRNDDYLPTTRNRSQGIWPSSQAEGSGYPYFGASPWQMMRRMQEDMDRVFGQFFGSPAQFGEGQLAEGQAPGIQQWVPHVDISETDKEWCIEADLPGVKKEDVDVQVRDQYLILRARLDSGQEPQGKTEAQGDQGKKDGQSEQAGQRQYHRRERRWGYFERVLTLPENADDAKISCNFENGVLTVHVPKTAEPAPQARRIPIGAGASQSGQKAAGQPQAQPQGERATAGTGGGPK